MNISQYPFMSLALLGGILSLALATYQLRKSGWSVQLLGFATLLLMQATVFTWCCCTDLSPASPWQPLLRQGFLILLPTALGALCWLLLLLTDRKCLLKLPFLMLQVNLFVLALILCSPLVVREFVPRASHVVGGPLFAYALLSIGLSSGYTLWQLGKSSGTRSSLESQFRARFFLGLISWAVLTLVLVLSIAPGAVFAESVSGAFVAGSFVMSTSFTSFVSNEEALSLGYYLRKTRAFLGAGSTSGHAYTEALGVLAAAAISDQSLESLKLNGFPGLMLGESNSLQASMPPFDPSSLVADEVRLLDVDNARLLTTLRGEDHSGDKTTLNTWIRDLPQGLDIGAIATQAEENIARNRMRFGIPLIGVSPEILGTYAFLSTVQLSISPIVLMGPPGIGKSTIISAVHANRLGTTLITVDLSEPGELQGFVNNVSEIESQKPAVGVHVKGLEQLGQHMFSAVWSALEKLSQQIPVYASVNDSRPSETLEEISRRGVRLCKLSPLRDRPLDLVYQMCWLLRSMRSNSTPALVRIEAYALYQALLHSWPENYRELAQVIREEAQRYSSDRVSSLPLSTLGSTYR